jgi:mono/diheme cytochrome c family protein
MYFPSAVISENRRMACRLLFVLLLFATATAVRAAEPVDYLREVKPIFQRHCYACHGALKQKSGLRLDTAAAIRKGSEAGAVIEAGKPDESRLIELVSSADDDRMPPKEQGTPLSAEEIETLRRWIAQGATGPDDEKPQADPREHWSYRPVERPALPVVKNAAWARNPIDLFIAAEHDKRELMPRPEAPRAVWLRRVFLDLIGLPPTRDELHAFLEDESTHACERVVEGLLARPEYGQRWGRHWMDVWRYSDWYGSRGINEIRYSQRHIWRWRDWIVDSLNADKPYDRMVTEMLAGDEIAPTDPEALAATGFIGRNWYKFDRNVWMFDAVEHTAQAFLGLTIRCARCHDHKYDPISQEDYYRLRAFFEPHDVRTDALAADTPTEKDATLGQVLKDGVARVYDKQLDVPTYVFQRGDSRYPDEKRPMRPGVPAALGNDQLDLQPVSLPAEAYYPALKPFMIEALLAQGKAGVEKSRQEADAAKQAAAAARRNVEELAARIEKGEASATPEPAAAFYDDFSKARPDDWKTVSGQWVYENGRLLQKSVQSFATLVSIANHPRDFKARWNYRPLQEGKLRSIGFSFDFIDQGNSQDIYTHLTDASQGIQAFHRLGGQQVYPPAAIVKTTTLKVDEPAVVEITVRGLQLTILLNGQKQLDYLIPVPRREGKFALWAHEGTAEFQELEIRALVPTLDDLKREDQIAADAVKLAEEKISTAQLELESLKARVVAEKAKFAGAAESDMQNLALAASRAERAVAAAKAAQALLEAEQQLARVRAAEPHPATEVAAPSPALAEAEKKLTEARQALTSAQAALENPDGKYAPLGEQFPATSTGRRAALARWIADAKNPRTARIAVNHIWLRHFGQALVPTVENFGLNGQPPTHPELLDWLTAELVENGWRMKPIHRLIVLSATYRLSSADGAAGQLNRRIDPENLYLWRMNSRRLEAEAVRDCVLAAAETLDRTRGGPEIHEGDGQTVLRRSLYFRLTPNDKMKFLELFDAADPNACYRRRESVVPQQALALMNSALALDQGRELAARLTREVGENDDENTNTAYVVAAFEQVLSRAPTDAEREKCLAFLRDSARIAQDPTLTAFPAGGQTKRSPAREPHLRARENLIHVLFNHNDFVTVR